MLTTYEGIAEGYLAKTRGFFVSVSTQKNKVKSHYLRPKVMQTFKDSVLLFDTVAQKSHFQD